MAESERRRRLARWTEQHREWTTIRETNIQSKSFTKTVIVCRDTQVQSRPEIDQQSGKGTRDTDRKTERDRERITGRERVTEKGTWKDREKDRKRERNIQSETESAGDRNTSKRISRVRNRETERWKQ